MSFEGQVDCQRMLIGPWALTIVGKPSVAAPAVAAAAPARNLRREAVSVFLDCSLLISSSFGSGNSWMVVPASFFLFPGTFCGKRFVGFPPRAPGVCTRQSPRIVFLVRPEIKPLPTPRALPDRDNYLIGAAGVVAAGGLPVALPALWGALGCHPMTKSSTKKPTT